MSDQLVTTLRALRIQRIEEAIKKGSGELTGPIFPYSTYHIMRFFKRLLTRARIRTIRFHDIRHSVASILLSDGVSPVMVKELLGHASIRMTVDVYGHMIPGANRDVVNGLDTQKETSIGIRGINDIEKQYEIKGNIN